MKSLFTSKTFWVNLAALVAGLAVLFASFQTGLVSEEIGFKITAALGFAQGIINLILRIFFTNTAISLPGSGSGESGYASATYAMIIWAATLCVVAFIVLLE